MPPTVAVMVADPAVSAVRRPVLEILATAGALELHVAVRTPLVLLESVAFACKSRVSPSTNAPGAGVMVTAVTLNTVTLTVPVLAPTVTPMMAVPGATATIAPAGVTEATVGALELNVAGSDVPFVPLDMVTDTVSAADSPGINATLDAVTDTDKTVGV